MSRIVKHALEVAASDAPLPVKARALHDGALAMFLFSYIPPLRTTIVTSILAPGLGVRRGEEGRAKWLPSGRWPDLLATIHCALGQLPRIAWQANPLPLLLLLLAAQQGSCAVLCSMSTSAAGLAARTHVALATASLASSSAPWAAGATS